MDDMVYQCSNQNSIYVLNAGYNSSYGDFGRHAMTGAEQERTTRTRNSIGASCSSAACSLQHKFKTFSGNSSVATATTAAAAAAATIPTATTTANYINPVATSMSTAMCSPATAALQKLFNCSGVAGVCQNVSHRNQQQNHSNNHSSNNNCSVGSHNNCCLSAAAAAAAATQEGSVNGTGSGSGSIAGALPLLGASAAASVAASASAAASAMANKKKCTNVKSTLIAKKTKFLKFLEEEKWRSSHAQLTPELATNAPNNNNNSSSSNEADLYTASTSTGAAASSLAGHSSSKNNNGNMKNHNNSSSSSSGRSSQEVVGAEQQQNKLNNWSMHNDNNNKLNNYTQQQQQHHQQQQQQLERNKQEDSRSSYELYQEAADILGLSCSLCDNCRCLDCQSGYFDCTDDDDESYSEQSLMDEYDEYDYGYEEQPLFLTSAHQPDHGQEEREQEQEQEHETELELCYAVDCQQNCSKNDVSRKEGTIPESDSVLEHCVAIDFDLINATSSQVLENCVTFNDLSLLDPEHRVEPFT